MLQTLTQRLEQQLQNYKGGIKKKKTKNEKTKNEKTKNEKTKNGKKKRRGGSTQDKERIDELQQLINDDPDRRDTYENELRSLLGTDRSGEDLVQFIALIRSQQNRVEQSERLNREEQERRDAAGTGGQIAGNVKVYTGPKQGKFIINRHGKKVYIDRKTLSTDLPYLKKKAKKANAAKKAKVAKK